MTDAPLSPNAYALGASWRGLGFVAAWVGLGYLFPVSAEAYLLMGIPLTIAFQVLVRRRPVRELLVRGGPALDVVDATDDARLPTTQTAVGRAADGRMAR
jgi:hypothetical protein